MELLMAPSTNHDCHGRPTWAVLVTAVAAVAPHGAQRLSLMAKVEGVSIEGEVWIRGLAGFCVTKKPMST